MLQRLHNLAGNIYNCHVYILEGLKYAGATGIEMKLSTQEWKGEYIHVTNPALRFSRTDKFLSKCSRTQSLTSVIDDCPIMNDINPVAITRYKRKYYH